MTEVIILLKDTSKIFFLSLLAIIFIRIIYINGYRFYYIGRIPRIPRKNHGYHIVAVLGSGGHSAEMLSLLRDIDPSRYIHRTYIASSGDKFAIEKASQLEEIIQIKLRPSEPKTDANKWDPVTGTWDVKIVPRARKIHQSLFTTPFSSMWCIFESIRALHMIAKNSKAAPNEFPDVIVANGPATAAIVIFAANFIRFLGFAPAWKMKVIYVESWARVKSLSLSGKLLLKLKLCDRFLVQWETLAQNTNKNGAKKVEWCGFLVE
ncbi:UDP-N-acetylglucosamine transferase subunit alg14 [Erysiphe necator]|uniref:UDP-N-acetylglucosamine transferase subunit ALG14 n=1 Tax=Uncinula necator TaxID=52586 RepID=A0A0B1PE38_UNCNE|nr:UDP-N-acetylglucosamine transferase subunit alg14 [Erysiphe necator]KHJ35610.1 putative glycosyltransferase family protein [Erysiphe necator]